MAGSGSAFNTLANAILILKVNGIHTVCKPLEPDVYDVPHCWCINLQWGKQAINTTALKTVELQISFNISFKERPPYVGISLTDSALNGNERPIGFIKDPVSLNEFTLCNRSEIDSGANSYFWIALGKI